MNTIRKAGDDGITFAEINEKWLDTDMSEGVELARSTFKRHKDAIEDIFCIYIDCNHPCYVSHNSQHNILLCKKHKEV